MAQLISATLLQTLVIQGFAEKSIQVRAAKPEVNVRAARSKIFSSGVDGTKKSGVYCEASLIAAKRR